MSKLRTATQFVRERIDQHMKATGKYPNEIIIPPWIAANLYIEQEYVDCRVPSTGGHTFDGVNLKITGRLEDLEECIALARAFARIRHLVENAEKVEVK